MKLTPEQVRNATLIAQSHGWSFNASEPRVELEEGKPVVIFGSNTFPVHRVTVLLENIDAFVNDYVALYRQ